ncbi:MAG: NHLP leader peptide family RiPP precursor [Geminicoccaceae bacterium]
MADQQVEAGNVAYGKVVAKAWSDSAFKAKLLRDPRAALAEAGVPVAAGVTIKVIEDTESTRHLILPPPPPEGELSDESLDKVAGGGGSSSCGRVCLTCR